jgi:hypothetical protein
MGWIIPYRIGIPGIVDGYRDIYTEYCTWGRGIENVAYHN